MTTKHPVLIMTFGEVTCDGDVITLVMFPYCHRFSMETYIKSVDKILYTGIERMAAERHYIWQQDCTMPHKQQNPMVAVKKCLKPLHLQHLTT